MAPMLPAPRRDAPSLADVLTGAFGAIVGEPGLLDLPPVRAAAVVLVDGLGASLLRAHAGHARRLTAAAPARADIIESGFPTTTASALATLSTGLSPGQHGLVGFSAIDRAGGRVVPMLTGWDARTQPLEWQPHPTVFERAGESGVDAVVVGAERYRDSGFTAAVLRGARWVAAASIDERLQLAAALLREPGERIVYVYIPELDMAGHAHGVDSTAWLERLEELDAALAVLDNSVPRDTGVLLTADHGMLDLAPHQRLVVAESSDLWEGVRFVAGEPRCLQLGLEDVEHVDAVVERWRAAEGSRAWVVSREEAIDAGWFGTVAPAVLPRIGDVLVAARARVAYYDERSASSQSLAMVGQHGSFSPEEVRVPLARWAAFRR